MSDRRTSLSKAGRILKIVLNLLLAIPALGLGVMTLFSPYVPAGALSENAIAGIALLGTAAILFFDLYKPFLGGVLLIAWAVGFSMDFTFLSIFFRPVKSATKLFGQALLCYCLSSGCSRWYVRNSVKTHMNRPDIFRGRFSGRSGR